MCLCVWGGWAPRFGSGGQVEQETAGRGAPALDWSSSLTGLFLQVVAFLAILMGTHTLSFRLQKDCIHWPRCFPYKEQDSTGELNTVLTPPPEIDSHHPASCRASADGPLNSRSISPWRYV